MCMRGNEEFQTEFIHVVDFSEGITGYEHL